MALRFAKILTTLPDSSLNDLPLPWRWCWVVLLVMAYEADDAGLVRGTPEALARRANMSLGEVLAALESFESPDPRSGTPDDEGRRIRTVPGGWVLVNYERVRAAERSDTRRARVREAVQRHRGRTGGGDADAAATDAEFQREPEARGASAGPGSEVGPPPAALRGGRAVQPNVALGMDGKPRDSYQPTVEYPTREAWDAAVDEARRLQFDIEGATGRRAESVFKEAADYVGATGMKTRPENCTAPRLEKTLLTLREWWAAIMADGLSGDAAWSAKPRIGTAPAPRKPGQIDLAAGAARLLLGDGHANAGHGGHSHARGDDRGDKADAGDDRVRNFVPRPER